MVVCVGDDESVAVSVTVNDWAVVNVWVTVFPEPVVPSPKFQVMVYGDIPFVVTAVKATGVLTRGAEGRNVKPVDKGGGGDTVTVLELVAVWDGEEESVAVSVTVKVWALVKV